MSRPRPRCDELATVTSKEFVATTPVDIRSRASIVEAINATVAAFGGVDIVVNTAALFPSSPDGTVADAQWATTLDVNVTANYLLADEAAKLFAEQHWTPPSSSRAPQTPLSPSAAAKLTTSARRRSRI